MSDLLATAVNQTFSDDLYQILNGTTDQHQQNIYQTTSTRQTDQHQHNIYQPTPPRQEILQPSKPAVEVMIRTNRLIEQLLVEMQAMNKNFMTALNQLDHKISSKEPGRIPIELKLDSQTLKVPLMFDIDNHQKQKIASHVKETIKQQTSTTACICSW